MVHIQRLLLFPLARIKICLFLFERTCAESPCRSRRKCMNAAKEGPILKDATAGNELAKPRGIHGAQFRPDGENRLSLRREVKGLRCLMVVYAIQTETIVEQSNNTGSTVKD